MVRAPSTSVGMSWISVPPIATFSTCMPRQIASTGTVGLDRGLGQRDLEGVAAGLGRFEGGMRRLAVERRIHVAAAGQHDAARRAATIVGGRLVVGATSMGSPPARRIDSR